MAADVLVVRLKKAVQLAADIIEMQAREYRHPDCMCTIDVRTRRGTLCGWCGERFKTIGVMRAMGAFNAEEEVLWALLTRPVGVRWLEAQDELVALLRTMDAADTPFAPPNLP